MSLPRRFTRRSAAVALAIAGVSLALCSSPALAAPVLKGIWGPDSFNGHSAFPTYRALRADVFSTTIQWSDVAPNRPKGDATRPSNSAYRWPKSVDRGVAGARAAHMRVAMTVQFTPSWANGGRSRDYAPTHDADFARFLRAVARRYSGVRYWLIWGEPTRNFQPMSRGSTAGPRNYARLLDAAYVALKRANRRNRVIGGNTYTTGTISPPGFIRGMRLPNGRPPRLDYYGHNPFSFRYPDLRNSPQEPGVRDLSDIDTLSSDLRRSFHRTVPLWLSEFTVQTDQNTRAFNFHVSRDEQAAWVTGAYRLVNRFRFRRTRPVVMLGWFNLIDRGGSDPLTTGLMDANFNPKPAFGAYRSVP